MFARLIPAALLALAASSCRVTASAEAGPEVPIFGGSKVEVSADGRTVTPLPDPDGGYPREGDCVVLTFTDASGKVVGTAQVPAGTPAVGPKGSVAVSWTPCPPKPVEADQVKGKGAVKLEAPGYTLAVRSVPIDWSRGWGRFVDFTATAVDRASAEALAASFQERNPLSRPRPEGIHAYGFADVRIQGNGVVRFSLLTWGPPRSFSLTWNGAPVASSLSEARVLPTPGGWYVTTRTVPRELVDLEGPECANAARYTVSTDEDDLSGTVGLRFSR